MAARSEVLESRSPLDQEGLWPARVYWDVKEQAVKARGTMNALAKEFRQKPIDESRC